MKLPSLTTASFLFLAFAAGCGGNAADTTATGSQPLTFNGAPQAAPGARGAQHFARRFDRNGDGTVQVAELPAQAQQRLAAADTNHDGTLAPEEMRAFHEAKRAERFARMDANGDGAVSADEAGERWGFLQRADADGNGSVTRAELDQARAAGTLRGDRGGRGFHGRRGWGMRGEGFRGPGRFDQNGDGQIQVSELPPRAQERLGAADANHDGTISQDEMRAFREAKRAERLAQMDTNHDGQIQVSELPPRMQARFGAADANHDGTLSQDEMRAAREQFRAERAARQQFRGERAPGEQFRGERAPRAQGPDGVPATR